MSANIETIAQMVGCSIATVSRVLNNTETVSPPLRQAILRAMREVNYIPRKRVAQRPEPAPSRGVCLHAQSDTTPDQNRVSRPALVDVLLHWQGPVEHYSFPQGKVNIDYVEECNDGSLQNTERIGNSFFRSIIDGICAELPEWGYRPVLQTVTDIEDRRRRQTLQEQPLDGVILVGQPTESLADFLEGFHRPVVLADVPAGERFPRVTVDSRQGIELAFAHLRSLGHTRIGFLQGPLFDPVYQERFDHFRFCMMRDNLPTREDWVYRGFTQVSATAEWARPLLVGGDYPSAFLCSNDILALGLLRAAAETGVAVPEQISVAGFDDIDAASVVTPALTSVRVPTFELGREAARQLVLQLGLDRPLPLAGKILLRPELVVRSSTARARGMV